MFKHLKTSIIVIVLTFSFIMDIYALDSFTMGNGTVINQEYIDNLWDTYINGKTSNDITNSSSTDPLYTKEYEKGVFNDILIYPLDNNRIYIGWFDKSQIILRNETSTTIQFQFDNPNVLTGYRHSPAMNFNTSTNTVQAYFGNYPSIVTINKNNPAHQCNAGSGFKVCYNNFDLIYNNINYLSNNFEYNSNLIPIIFNFHLNGGHATTNLIGFIPYLVFNDSDFSFSNEAGDFETFLTSLDIEKDGMIFDGLYYDPNFTQPLTLNDNFNDYAMVVDDQKVINLYAKYRYKNVDDFLSNVNFNEYTFDTNYDYAIINRGDNSNSVYIGLPFNNYELEIYEYQENTNSYKEGSSACLVPIFNKNHQYYYELNTLFTHNQEVLILPRQMFDQLDPNTFNDPGDAYKFYLTDNAYVTYATDLTHVTITNSQGQQIDTNLQNSFELSQQYKNLYSDEKDIYAQIKIFLNNITRYTTAIKEMFQYLFNSLNSTIRSFIIFLVVLILLSTILRFIRRG